MMTPTYHACEPHHPAQDPPVHSHEISTLHDLLRPDSIAEKELGPGSSLAGSYRLPSTSCCARFSKNASVVLERKTRLATPEDMLIRSNGVRITAKGLIMAFEGKPNVM